jgi:hypothetical protein
MPDSIYHSIKAVHAKSAVKATLLYGAGAALIAGFSHIMVTFAIAKDRRFDHWAPELFLRSAMFVLGGLSVPAAIYFGLSSQPKGAFQRLLGGENEGRHGELKCMSAICGILLAVMLATVYRDRQYDEAFAPLSFVVLATYILQFTAGLFARAAGYEDVANLAVEPVGEAVVVAVEPPVDAGDDLPVVGDADMEGEADVTDDEMIDASSESEPEGLPGPPL